MHVYFQVGSVAGVIAVVATLTLISLSYPFMYNSPWQIYLGSFCLPFIGFAFGYIVAKLFRLNAVMARTVALETGVQNFPLCMTVITLSFPSHVISKLALFPLLSGVFIITNSCVFLFAYLIVKKIKSIRSGDNDQPRKELHDEEQKTPEMELMFMP